MSSRLMVIYCLWIASSGPTISNQELRKVLGPSVDDESHETHKGEVENEVKNVHHNQPTRNSARSPLPRTPMKERGEVR